MINVSQTIKNSCKSATNTHTEYIVINGETKYIKGKLSATAYKDTTFIGTFNMKVLEFEADNTTQYINRQFEYYKVIDGNSFKIGTFITTETVNNDSKDTVKVTANDFALKFAIPYISTLDYDSGEITLFDVLEECCSNAGVVLKNESITNGDFIVDSNQFVNNELIGDVISAIAGISGNFATITDDDKLELLFTNDTDEILEDYTDLDDKRDTQPFTSILIGSSQVSGQDAIAKNDELIALYGEHWVKIIDNPFAYTLAKRQTLVTALLTKLQGFGYSSFKSEYTYKPYLTLGDKIKFKNKAGQLVNSVILRYEFDFDNCTFEAPSITSATIDYSLSADALQTAKRAEIIANQAEASITSIASQVDQQNNKISTITQTVDEIDAKIQDIADITTSADSLYGTITLTDINESEPIAIKIHPTTVNISRIYPNSSLYPNSTLYTKNLILRFTNTSTNENIDYVLPDNLLYYDSETYDEFYLDYDDSVCQVTKKCGYNADGTVYKLTTEVVNSYTYPTINLTTGDYTITLLGHSNAYLYCRLMAANIYTTQFATRAEVNSSIDQKATEITSTVAGTYATKNELNTAKSQIQQTTDAINLQVSQKIGSSEVVSSINQSAEQITLNSNRLVINSSNFKLDANGQMQATGGKIAGYNITNNDLYAEMYPKYTYYESDLERARNIWRGTISPTQQDYQKYDLDGDGSINAHDVLRISKLVNYGITTTNPLIITMSTGVDLLDSAFELKDGAGNSFVKLGIDGLTVSDDASEECEVLAGTWDYAYVYKQYGQLRLIAHASSLSGTSGAKLQLPAKFITGETLYFYGTLSGKHLSRWYINEEGEVGIDWCINVSNGNDYTTATWHQIDFKY